MEDGVNGKALLVLVATAVVLGAVSVMLATLADEAIPIPPDAEEPVLVREAPRLDPRAEIAAKASAQVEQARELERWFDLQERDPGWAPVAEDSLDRAFGALEGLVFEADCAAEACRLQLDFEDVEVRDSTMTRVPFLLPWEAEGFVATLDEQGLRIAIYVAREGSHLPRDG